MNKLYWEALKAYIEVLELHIDTKTNDYIFHKESENIYKELFEIAHSLGEKHVDLWWTIDWKTLDKRKKSLLILQNLKEKIEKYKQEENVSLWTEDLLWSIANKLEDMIWTSKSLAEKTK